MDRVAIGLDVGGTKVAGALVRGDGEVLWQRVVPCPRDASGAEPGLAATAALAADLAAAAASQGLAVAAAGVGMPEYVGPDGLVRSREVLAWTAQPATLLGRILPGVRIVVDADVRCGAVAEARFGAGRGRASALYVSLGTGLSSTLVLDGVPLAGARGEAIALGELDSPDGAGRLEPHCSGAGIAATYSAATAQAATGAAAPTGRAPAVAGGLAVQALADAGDAVALEILRTAGSALGAALGGAVRLLDPEVVILGGGLGSVTGTIYAHALNGAYDARVGERPDPPPLVRAALGAASGVIGAALRALD